MLDILRDAKMENFVLKFKKLIYVHGRVKSCYYEALIICPGHPEKGGIKFYERNTGTFHKH